MNTRDLKSGEIYFYRPKNYLILFLKKDVDGTYHFYNMVKQIKTSAVFLTNLVDLESI